MKDMLECDVIKIIKFFLILIALFYFIFAMEIALWPCIIFVFGHVSIFAFDLTHRLSKGRWRYKPY